MTEKEIKDRIENNICLECGKPITDDGKFFCKDCLEKSKEHFYKTEIGKSLKDSGEIKALLKMTTMPLVFKYIHKSIVERIDETLKEFIGE